MKENLSIYSIFSNIIFIHLSKLKFNVKVAGFNYSKISFPVNVGVISAVEEKGELLLEKLWQKLDIIFDSMIALQEDVKLKDKRIMELQNSLAARDRRIEEIEHRLEDKLEKAVFTTLRASPCAFNISNICRDCCGHFKLHTNTC